MGEKVGELHVEGLKQAISTGKRLFALTTLVGQIPNPGLESFLVRGPLAEKQSVDCRALRRSPAHE
jgi:hypothetical protein